MGLYGCMHTERNWKYVKYFRAAKHVRKRTWNMKNTAGWQSMSERETLSLITEVYDFAEKDEQAESKMQKE